MPETVEGGPSNLDTPRSPVSISADSSRCGSSKPVHPEKDSELPTPNFPFTRLTRKRAATLNTDGANHPKIGDLALNSVNSIKSLTSDPTREQVCLCQPDPKIPRPRNAFILYRQHYQAQVVAQHPGLANPEISKIIGEQWREQAPEVKSGWKKLAEEEKLRHQRQYPGYRYQPKRNGKPSGVRPELASTVDELGRCPKCSGRYISTPSTPLTPFTSAFGAAQATHLLPAFTPSVSSPRGGLPSQLDRPRYPSRMQNVRMDSPRTAPPHQQTHRRPLYPPQPLHAHRERDNDMDIMSPSPDLKRRRFTNEPQRGYPLSSSPVSYSTPQAFSRDIVPVSVTGYRQQQLPGAGILPRQGNMGPPPSQSPMIQQTPRNQYPPRSSTFDESLRLPPLQTQLPNSIPTSFQRLDIRMNSRESQAKSVEAMVMTIPYVSKIKVLTKISPPLAPNGPTSPAWNVRGAFIAVESADEVLLQEIGSFINEHLSKDPLCAIKTWNASPPPNRRDPPAPNTEMTNTGTQSRSHARPSSEHVNSEPFIEYLSIISEWHQKSSEITQYITSTPIVPPAENSSSSASKKLPVALVPRGFSLTTSDVFALRIPINDSYAPVDHWQWMATLWRGIVGPDLTIYAKRVDKDEMDRCGGVEMREDCSGIIVRIIDSGDMDEKTARRLGFEVMEFVRSMEGGFGRH